MDNPRFNLSDRFQRLGGIALALMFIMLSTASAWADTSPSLELKHAFGDKATVTFYTFSNEEKKAPTTSDISSFTANDATTRIDENCNYVVAHIVPKAGYWTNEALLYASLMANETVAVAATRGADINGPAVVTLIQPDQGRNDGAGWYCFEFPEEGLMWNNDFTALAYKSLLLDGYVLPKFDLSKATAGTDGVTCTEGQWSTTLTIDNSKTSFNYNGSEQGPTKLTNTSIIVKNGDDVAVTFATVGDHVSASVGAKEGSSLNDGKAIDVGSYALTINANATAAEETLDGANTRGSSTAPAESDIFTGIFVNSKDVDFTITPKALTITAEAKTKTYGEADPTLTYTKEGLLEGDAITGALARAAGEDVGEYAITQGTLSAGDNYTITFTGAKLTINAADFAEGDVTAKDYEGIYDGEAHTITVTAPKSATVEYGTKKDSYDLKEAPSYTDAGEYTVYYKVSMPNINPVTGSQTIKISKKTLTITANAQEKVAGEKDPDLTYTSDGLVEGDAITGALARAEGEGVGEYDITQGTLTAGDNYTIAFTGAKLTIKDIKKSFKVVVAESEGGSVSVSKIEAFPGTQINMKIIPVTGYHLETITIKKSHGGEVQHDITFDAKGESWDYFLMPSDDVIITAVFEKDKAAQNIFIYKSYYGEVVANTISADENEPVNLVAHPAYDNCVLDELVVINDEGKQLDLTTPYDSKEGNIYTFMMAGNWVQVFSTFRGTNDVVDGARPFGLDKRFYQLSQKDQNILQTTAETKDVQIGLSLNANIFCQVADDGSLMKKQGEDVGLMIGGLKKGNFFRIDHDGEIVLENPDIVKIINDAFPQPAHILTRGEDTAIIKPGVAYEVVEDGNLELVLKGSAPLVIKSIIVEGPEPTAINRLQADDEAADLYDLSGRKVDPTSLRKGMYIRNGKKIIIK